FSCPGRRSRGLCTAASASVRAGGVSAAGASCGLLGRMLPRRISNRGKFGILRRLNIQDRSENMHSADDWKQQERARRQREMARIIEPEFRPGRVLVVGDCGLARALRDRQSDAWGRGEGRGGGGGMS